MEDGTTAQDRTLEELEKELIDYILKLRLSVSEKIYASEVGRANRIVSGAERKADEIRKIAWEKIERVRRTVREGMKFTDEQRGAIQSLITAYNEDPLIGTPIVIQEDVRSEDKIALPSKAHSTIKKRLSPEEVVELVRSIELNRANASILFSGMCIARADRTFEILKKGGYTYADKPKGIKSRERMPLEELLKLLAKESGFELQM